VINNWEPLYPYLEAFSILLLGHSNFAYRLPSALIGIALIPLAYLLGARLRDRYVGLTLAAMVAFSSEYIAWSRQARWYMLFVFLMALGFLALLLWDQASSRRARSVYLLGAASAAIGVGLASIGLFLLYAPGILAGVLAFLVVTRWDGLRRFFRGPLPNETGAPPTSSGRWVPYRYRIWVLLLVALVIVFGAWVEESALSRFTSYVLTRIVGVPPFPLVWSTNLGGYLLDYYLPIVVLAFLSVYFIARDRKPMEIGLLVCAAVSFASVSVFASVTNDIAGGSGGSFPRHLLPLEFLLFVLSSLSCVGIIRWVVAASGHRWPTTHRLRRAAPALFGVAIVAMLVAPSALVPPSHVLNSRADENLANVEIPWVPFSVDPQYPSALYETLQANYQLAAEYVIAHRAAGDVIASTNPGPVQVYAGFVQYYVRSNAQSPWLIEVNGVEEFYETGSALVANTTQFEGILLNSSGWFISDVPGSVGPAFEGGMHLVVRYFMTPVAAGSDPTIALYHWNQSTPSGLLEMLIHEIPGLNSSLGNKTLQQQLYWAVTRGVTIDGNRDALLPLAPSLIALITAPYPRGLGVLVNVYNERPDLQAEFPAVLTDFNDTGLLAWGCSVASGTVTDPAYTTLAPYVKVYCG